MFIVMHTKDNFLISAKVDNIVGLWYRDKRIYFPLNHGKLSRPTKRKKSKIKLWCFNAGMQCPFYVIHTLYFLDKYFYLVVSSIHKTFFQWWCGVSRCSLANFTQAVMFFWRDCVLSSTHYSMHHDLCMVHLWTEILTAPMIPLSS